MELDLPLAAECRTPKIGVGRVLDGKRLLRILEPDAHENETAAAPGTGPRPPADLARHHESGPGLPGRDAPVSAARWRGC